MINNLNNEGCENIISESATVGIKDKLVFKLTGNFQYDVAILGLLNVLKFFKIRHEYDAYSISIDRNDWPKVGHCAYLYGYHYKGINFAISKLKLSKKYAEKADDYRNIISTGNEPVQQTEREQEKTKIGEFFKKSQGLFGSLNGEFKHATPASIINMSHLNRFNNSTKGDRYKMFVDEFRRTPLPVTHDSVTENMCDLCGRYEADGGERNMMNRMNFLFAPSAANYSWFEGDPLLICDYCSSLNMLATFGTVPFRGGKNYFIYSSNLKTMGTDNTMLANQQRDGQGIFKHCLLGLLQVKNEMELKDKQFIEFHFDSQKPYVDILPLQISFLRFLYDTKDVLSSLASNDFTLRIGTGKNAFFYNGFEEIVKALLKGESLFPVISFFLDCLIKERGGNKNFRFSDGEDPARGIADMIGLSIKWENKKNNS